MILAVDLQAMTEALESHAASTGDFERVNRFEPKSPPSNGLTCAIWVQSLRPHTASSGLAATDGYLIMSVRVYDNMLRDPQDMIDPELLGAVNKLIATYSADFTLDGLIRNVDLLGEGEAILGAEAGYVQIGGQGGGMYRIMTITVPMVINEAWVQTA